MTPVGGRRTPTGGGRCSGRCSRRNISASMCRGGGRRKSATCWMASSDWSFEDHVVHFPELRVADGRADARRPQAPRTGFLRREDAPLVAFDRPEVGRGRRPMSRNSRPATLLAFTDYDAFVFACAMASRPVNGLADRVSPAFQPILVALTNAQATERPAVLQRLLPQGIDFTSLMEDMAACDPDAEPPPHPAGDAVLV